MSDSYLTGGELTMLTVLWWTHDPFVNGYDHKSDRMGLDGLIGRGLAKQTDFNGDGKFHLTAKGECLMNAIRAIQEPVNEWRIP